MPAERQSGNRWVRVQRKRIDVRGGRFATTVRPKTPGPVPRLDHRRRRRPAAARCAPGAEVSRPASDHWACVGSSWIPRGRALPPEVWAARHRGLLLVLAAHLMVLPAFAVTRAGRSRPRGASPRPRVFGAAACSSRLRRAVRSSLCATALLSCSAVLVVAWHGTTEAHFHYFVMVGALALYEGGGRTCWRSRLSCSSTARWARCRPRPSSSTPRPVALGRQSTACSSRP